MLWKRWANKVSLSLICALEKTTDRLNVLLVGWELMGAGADDSIGGNVFQGLDGPSSLFRRLNKTQTK